jgi:uncharacterized coiled-coil protein SlyX
MNRWLKLALLTAVTVAAVLLVVSCAKGEKAYAPEPMAPPAEKASSALDGSESLSSSSVARAAEASPAAPGRVLVKTGGLTLIVGEATVAQQQVQDLVAKYEGYIAGKQVDAWVPDARYLAPSEVHQMSYTIKVPAGRFDPFVEELKAIGSYTSESMQIEDVTFEYVDLEARLANQKKVEERLLGHLENSARELKDIVEVERELARVREQVEALTAQFKVLQERVAFSTLTLTLSVQPDFVPPVERSFLQQLGEKFVASLVALGDAIQVGAIVALAALPWLLVLGGCGYALLRLLRWRRRKKKA